MNIAKLMMLQAELDAHIEEQHPRKEGESRHDKKVLSLLVELGELANESRFFKFWSYDQAPRKSKRIKCPSCEGTGYEDGGWNRCQDCDNPAGGIKTVFPLKEEFVDGIHFLLSIGLENRIEELSIKPIKKNTLTEQFIGLYNCFSVLSISFSTETYSEAWGAYVGLGEMLGLSWDDVEAAYLAKNEKNHKRQEESY